MYFIRFVSLHCLPLEVYIYDYDQRLFAVQQLFYSATLFLEQDCLIENLKNEIITKDKQNFRFSYFYYNSTPDDFEESRNQN